MRIKIYFISSQPISSPPAQETQKKKLNVTIQSLSVLCRQWVIIYITLQALKQKTKDR